MIWLSWRQQRIETLITAALLVVLAAAFVPAGVHAADLFSQQHLGACVDRVSAACGDAVGNFANGTGFVRSLLDPGWLNLVPGLIGVALAVPLLLDLEYGTTQLAWTQSVTRRRWLATKGGLAVGVLLRRSAAALLSGFGAYVAARLFVQSWLRQRFVTPVSATFASGSGRLTRAWVIGVPVPDHALRSCGQAHGLKPLGPGSHGPIRMVGGCITYVYQPASRFWEFQGIEFALFFGVALILIAFATWRVLRTD